MATPAVEALLLSVLPSIGIDDESYATYAAEVLCDASLPWEERKATLTDMFAISIDDNERVDDKAAAHALLANLLERGRVAFDDAVAAEAAQQAADEEADAARVAARLAEQERLAAAGPPPDAAAVGGDEQLSDSMKRLIMANYGFEYEEEDAPTTAGGIAAKKKADARAAAASKGGGTAAGGPSSAALDNSGLEAALGDLAEIDRRGGGGDTKGMGRRAKRAVERALDAPSPSPPPPPQSSPTGDDDEEGGGGGEGAGATPPPPPPVAANRSLVSIDYLEMGRLDNRAYKNSADKAVRDAQKAKGEADVRAAKEADEAARWVVGEHGRHWWVPRVGRHCGVCTVAALDVDVVRTTVRCIILLPYHFPIACGPLSVNAQGRARTRQAEEPPVASRQREGQVNLKILICICHMCKRSNCNHYSTRGGFRAARPICAHHHASKNSTAL